MTEDTFDDVGARHGIVAEGEIMSPGRLNRYLNLKDINWAYPTEVMYNLMETNSPYAFYIFQWVPYQTDAKRWRLKMSHDVKTFDGREAFGIWPNACMCGPFKDEEVEFIRISKNQGSLKWEDPRGKPEVKALLGDMVDE